MVVVSIENLNQKIILQFWLALLASFLWPLSAVNRMQRHCENFECISGAPPPFSHSCNNNSGGRLLKDDRAKSARWVKTVASISVVLMSFPVLLRQTSRMNHEAGSPGTSATKMGNSNHPIEIRTFLFATEGRDYTAQHTAKFQIQEDSKNCSRILIPWDCWFDISEWFGGKLKFESLYPTKIWAPWFIIFGKTE